MSYSDDEDYEPSQEIVSSDSGGDMSDGGTESGYETTLTDLENEHLFDDKLQLDQLLQELKPCAESNLEPFEVFRHRRRIQVQQSMAGTSGDGEGMDVEQILRKKRRRLRKLRQQGKPIKKRGGLSEQASQLLGKGMQFYVMGQLNDARNVLLEVMRLAPNVDQTYHTLGMIHEALNQPRQALHFFMIAAHLNPRNLDMWKQLVDLSLQLGFKRQTIYCLRRVNRLDKNDVENTQKRAELHYELGEIVMAIKTMEKITILTPDDPHVVKKLARWYYKDDKIDKAVEVLQQFSNSYWDKMNDSMVNILSELLIKQENFEAALDVLQRAENSFLEFAMDLKIKTGKCHVYLGNNDQAKKYLMQLQNQSIEQFDDLIWEAGQLLMQIQCFEEAAEFFKQLMEDERYNVPELWNMIGSCYGVEDVRFLSFYEDLYKCSSKEDAGYAEIVCNLCEALLCHDRVEEAKQFLNELENNSGELRDEAKQILKRPKRQSSRTSKRILNFPGQTTQLQVILRRANLFLQLGDTGGYLQILLPLVRSTVHALYGRMVDRQEKSRQKNNQEQDLDEQVFKQEVSEVLQQQEGVTNDEKTVGTDDGIIRTSIYLRQKDKRKNQERDNEQNNQEQQENEQEQEDTILIPRLFWDSEQMKVYQHICQLLFEQERWEDLEDVLAKGIDVMNQQNRWLQLGFRDSLKLLMMQVQVIRGDGKKAIDSMKVMCNRWPDSFQVWSNFCRLYCDVGSTKGWIRFIPALRDKFPDSTAIMIMSGHTHALARNHAFAIKEYCRAMEAIGEGNDLLDLCMEVAFCNFAMTRKVKDRHQAVLQALAIVQKYYKRRQNQQESAYNMGRAAHHLGLYDMAIRFYEEALSIQPNQKWATNFKNFPNDPTINTDIRMEAAHNLIQIYKRSGNFVLCGQIMQKFLVI